MSPTDLEKLLKIFALIQQGLLAANQILANKASQGGMETKDIFARAEQHTDEALAIINTL